MKGLPTWKLLFSALYRPWVQTGTASPDSAHTGDVSGWKSRLNGRNGKIKKKLCWVVWTEPSATLPGWRHVVFFYHSWQMWCELMVQISPVPFKLDNNVECVQCRVRPSPAVRIYTHTCPFLPSVSLTVEHPVSQRAANSHFLFTLQQNLLVDVVLDKPNVPQGIKHLTAAATSSRFTDELLQSPNILNHHRTKMPKMCLFKKEDI